MAQRQALQVDPTLVKRMKRFGAFDVSACFNCGNCTAICPLSGASTAFPRKMITYAQQGLEGKLLSSPDMWLCDYCGECTRTCPRQAEPSEFMMAARRFAISKYTPTPLAGWIFTSKVAAVLFMAAAALIPIGLFSTLQIPSGSADMFAFIPEPWIHYSGIGLGAVVGLAVLAGVLRMYVWVSRGMRESGQTGPGLKEWARQLVPTFLNDSLFQARSERCKTVPTGKELFTGRWFNHMAIFWGFAGLLLSTTLRFLVFPTGGAPVPLTDPVRLLGTVSGIALSYGTLAMMAGRLKKTDVSMRRTQFTDWLFLGLLLLSGLTGFALEVFNYGPSQIFVDWALAVHLVVVFELLVLAPFTKFAHAIYRPFAIWMSRAYHRV